MSAFLLCFWSCCHFFIVLTAYKRLGGGCCTIVVEVSGIVVVETAVGMLALEENSRQTCSIT